MEILTIEQLARVASDAGDAQSFDYYTLLRKRTEKLVWRVLWKHFKRFPAELKQAVVDEVYLRFLEYLRIGQLRSLHDKVITVYLYRMTANVARESAEFLKEADYFTSEEYGYIQADYAAIELIAHLSDFQRKVVILKSEKMKTKEISKLLGVTVAKINRVFYAIRRQLRLIESATFKDSDMTPKSTRVDVSNTFSGGEIPPLDAMEQEIFKDIFFLADDFPTENVDVSAEPDPRIIKLKEFLKSTR